MLESHPGIGARGLSGKQTIAVLAILSLHGVLLAWIAAVNAPMYDEIAHLPAGLSHWRTGTFDLYRVNPPLMRMIATTPLLLVNPQGAVAPLSEGPYLRPEFPLGRRFTELNGYNSFWYFTICRWAQIPVAIFGGWICFHWAREVSGTPSGFVSLLLWCFCPNVLAWGSTITPDLGAAVFGVAASYAFWKWLNTSTWKSVLLSGVALGLAELAKSTWIIFFVIWPAIWIIWRLLGCDRQLETKPQFKQLIAICGIGLYVLNLGYLFEGSGRRLGEFSFISHALGGANAHEAPGNRFRGTWLEKIPIPVPANYLNGIDVQKYDFEKGKWSYLRGEQKLGGWYHYYVYGLAVKLPLGTLVLLLLALTLVIWQRKYSTSLRTELALLLPAIAVVALVSSQVGFNRYIRYVLPALPFFYILISRVGSVFSGPCYSPKVICAIGLTGSIVGSLSVFPHSMSFFNLLAGGPRGGARHLLDANIDWGQDLLELKRFVERRPEVSPIQLAYFGFIDPKLAQFPFEEISSKETANRTITLKPGWYAISVNHVFGYRHHEHDRPLFTGFQRFVPDATAGYSILIYHLTAEHQFEW
jgi:hypothetical protein